jgi:hypothetical protein
VLILIPYGEYAHVLEQVIAASIVCLFPRTAMRRGSVELMARVASGYDWWCW